MSLDENEDKKKFMQENSGKTILPQVHKGSFCICGGDEAEEYNETGEFKKFLLGDAPQNITKT